ncbi:MAG TPA: haloacid dehalogenase type II [Candidatus Polarisedimenticolia bacterium]|nr:haloacid dehalogenase type II [Candidatus Polarisedimenticolia bacterium]
MLPFDRFEALTFDCFGTLVDWESGILEALLPVVQRHRVEADAEHLLRLYAEAESDLEAGPYLPYTEVLGRVMVRVGQALGFEPSAEERGRLARSLPAWPLFPDTVPSLATLARRFRLAIVSNVDDDLFAGVARRLTVPFDAVITAQQVRSYKPAPAHFLRALKTLRLPTERVLHVAQSRFHDIAPASALGFTTVWVNRRSGRAGSGATPEGGAIPDLEVPDLATLARAAAETGS